MPESISGQSVAYDNGLSVPADGEVASASALKSVFQRLIDNGKALYDRVFTSGVLAIRRVSNIAGLQALTGMSTGQVALVEKVGLFHFDAGASDGAVANFVVEPNAGGGRWFAMSLMRNAANGLAGLDSAAKLPVAQVPFGIVGIERATRLTDFTTTLTASEEVTDCSVSLTLAPGDRCLVLGSAWAKNSDPTSKANVYTKVFAPNALQYGIGTNQVQTGDGSYDFGKATLIDVFVASLAGAHRFYFTASSDSASHTTTIGAGSNLVVIAFRP